MIPKWVKCTWCNDGIMSGSGTPDHMQCGKCDGLGWRKLEP